MEHVGIVFQAGVDEAKRDIAAGRPRLRYGARGAWAEDLAQMLQAQFGVELVILSCFVTSESNSFDAGYNNAVETHIDAMHGAGSVAAVWAEVERRRKERYDAWVAVD